MQINPSCDNTGTPLHFHSSMTSGSASLTTVRSRLSILPRQSPSSLILASISREGDSLFRDPLFFTPVSLRLLPRLSSTRWLGGAFRTGGPKSLQGPDAGLGRFDFAIAWRRTRNERVEEL